MVPARNTNNGIRHYESRLPSFFNDFFGDDLGWHTRSRKSTPAINVTETDKAYNVEVAIPGVRKEDCTVRLNDDILTIAVASEGKSQEGDPKRYLRQEFSYSKFEQSFTLPDDVDKKGVGAEVRNGVLFIALPKVEAKKEEDKWQTIEVR